MRQRKAIRTEQDAIKALPLLEARLTAGMFSAEHTRDEARLGLADTEGEIQDSHRLLASDLPPDLRAALQANLNKIERCRKRLSGLLKQLERRVRNLRKSRDKVQVYRCRLIVTGSLTGRLRAR